jgi:ABC-type dipeptide/oligopeptide/nickel transport system permease component
MTGYIVRRLLSTIPTLLGVAILVFLITRLTPGDPARQIAGAEASEEKVAQLHHKLGLDKPVWEQFGIYVGHAVQGDLGRSLLNDRPVAKELATRFPTTFRVTTVAMLIALLVGLPLGVISAAKRNSAADVLATLISLFGVSMPLFWTAIMGILFFAVRKHWLPVGGLHGSIFTVAGAKAYVLPCVTLSLTPIALIARLTRSSMLEVLNREYVTVARAKGLPGRKVLVRHALRNALLPVTTFIGLQYGFLLGGAVVTETIFSLPGVGRLVVTSISQRDYPVIQGAILMIALIFVLINLLVDLLYAWLDPRISYA